MFTKGNYPTRLWKHQREALDFIISHLNAGPTQGPCVVRMPTGTGKTGVIAWLSMKSASGVTLVLAPWTNLREQMVESLREGFWKQAGIDAPGLSVQTLLPRNAKKMLAEKDVKVIVSSLAALTDLRRDDPPRYQALRQKIDLVIVDEGHYEPAVEWGKSVKELKKLTVLMTATPYRNDLKLFQISNAEKSVWQFRHHEAQRRRIIRSLGFESLGTGNDLNGLITNFVAYWKRVTESNSLVSDTPRAIICCSNAIAIKTVVAGLKGHGLSALGVHDSFSKDETKGHFHDVPPTDTNAEVWVHQYKLVEGLDDHRFCCVALFCPVQNDRKLVQQVGRALRRHASDRKGKSAILLAPDEFDIKRTWDAYMEFEKNSELVTTEHYRKVIDQLLSSQPDAEYFNRRFRKRFDVQDLDRNPKVTVAPSVLVRALSNTFKFNEYVADCTDTLSMADAIILGPKPFAPCVQSVDYALWIYATVQNSRLLERHSLYEIRLEAHCAVVSNGYLLISDSAGNYPVEILEDHSSGLAPGQLSSLLDSTFKLTNLSVSSAIPFDNVVRGADIRGQDIGRIPASLTDRIQICRAARGASPEHGRRYVGMKRGRVRQELSTHQRKDYSLPDFVSWCREVAMELSMSSSTNTVFERYMQTCQPPTNLSARSICVDLVRMGTLLINGEGEPVQVKRSSGNLTEVHGTPQRYELSLEFEGTVAPRVHITEKLLVDYQPQKKRFWFKSSNNSQIRADLGDPRFPAGRSLHDYLNANQDLVLIGLDGGEVVYQGRDFYAIDYRNAESTLLERIISLTGAARCATEKGTKDQIELAKGSGNTQKQSTFATGSIFNAIVTEKGVIPFDADLLICDDLSSECADFVAADLAGRKLALLHAKTGGGSSISASDFHEVVAQAIKNLVYLTPNAETPKGAKSWKSDVFWNKTGVPRILKTPTSVEKGTPLWKRLKADIIDAPDGELHVVLVTAGCCDKMRLKHAIDTPSARTSETAQLLHLLEGLNGYARQLGVRLTVVDIPFDDQFVVAARAKAATKKAVAQVRNVAPLASNTTRQRGAKRL
ncbi:DEAD/DEAH box helicase [Alcaligenes sp. Me129]|uniref:DEAD/DEAH box helicase n=1 Tax=Alcaligenes sp. Me129 TaxID=3392635 RepID=UPI003D23EB4E